MKPRAFKPFVAAALALWTAASLAIATAGAQEVSPKPEATAATPKAKKAKHPKDTGDPTLPPKTLTKRKAKDISIPVPEGQPAHDVTIPSYGPTGNLLSLVKSLKLTPIDKEHVQLEGATLDLNSPDGKDDYHIELPIAILNLTTNVVTSDKPVVIRTKEFDLTGEKMEFDAVERNGELRGHVHMRIRNATQLTAPGDDKPAPK